MESIPKTEDQPETVTATQQTTETEGSQGTPGTTAPDTVAAAGEANASSAPPPDSTDADAPTATATEVKEGPEASRKEGTEIDGTTAMAEEAPAQGETPTTPTPASAKEESRPKRRYNKSAFHDDGLSGSYWKTPIPPAPGAAAEDTSTSASSTSSRPRRSNAGSLMKTALQEFDRKKKATSTSPVKAGSREASTTPTRAENRGGRRSATSTAPASKDKDKEKDRPAPVVARKSEPNAPGGAGFRVGPYEKPVTRGRGRPGRHHKAESDEEDEEEDDDAEFEPVERKARGRQPSKPGVGAPAEEKLTPSKTLAQMPVRTYGRRSTAAAAVAAATPDERPHPRQPITKTYSRRRPSQRTEEIEPDSDSGTAGAPAAARVSPSTALIAALSIPDELLPTSHEKFLDKFRETQEKSPTPPERRVHNLDEVVATFKSSSGRSKAKQEAGGVGVGESEQNTPADSSAESEGDSESGGSSPSDDKENVGGSASGAGGAASSAAGGAKSAAAAAAAAAEDAARVQLLKWAEDVKPTVVKLGENQLSINDVVVRIDYTNYLKETDVEVPYDYDIVFQPEPPLEEPTPPDLLPIAGAGAAAAGSTATDALASNPASPAPSPAVRTLKEEESACVLEACAMGCVCQSLKRTSPPRPEHCGRPKCFLDCSCLFNHHVLIKGDGQNIRDRLRTRVKLLNWKSITNNGGREHPDERGEGGSSGKKHKLHKKDRGGKGKKGRESRDSEKRHKKGGAGGGGDAAAKAAPPKLTRGQLQQQQAAAAQAQSYKPGPKSSKPGSYANLSPGKASSAGAKNRGGVAGASSGQFKTPKRPPPLISTRFASNLPILRRIYSCQPCHVQLTKMPKKWSHWSTVESKCASLVPRRIRPADGAASESVPFHVATSNFKVAAQGDLSYTIVRPNGSILALLYWEAHTKEAPRSIHPHAGRGSGSGASSEVSYPWLYLPLPSSGKVWLFYEIPKYPHDLPAIYLPELGVFLPTDKLMLMTFEANQTGKTSKLYFERGDESKMTEQGLLNFVYLVPNLPSLIVYGPVPKNCLKTVNRRTMEKTLRAFEESEECKQMRKKLAEAGTDVEEVGGFSGLKYAPEYEDDFVRDSDLIGESIWEEQYQQFMIPANGYEDEDVNGEDGHGQDYEFPYDFEDYVDYDNGDEEIWEVARDQEDRQDQNQEETYVPEVQMEDEREQETAEGEGAGGADEIEVFDLEDESEFQELEEITLMDEVSC